MFLFGFYIVSWAWVLILRPLLQLAMIGGHTPPPTWIRLEKIIVCRVFSNLFANMSAPNSMHGAQSYGEFVRYIFFDLIRFLQLIVVHINLQFSNSLHVRFYLDWQLVLFAESFASFFSFQCVSSPHFFWCSILTLDFDWHLYWY